MSFSDFSDNSTSSNVSSPTSSPVSSGNYSFQESLKSYQDITLIRKLSKAKFPVYLVCSNTRMEQYAMKVFKFEKERPHSYYENEIRFAGLDHPNVIKTVYYENERKSRCKGVEGKISYKLMEYAPHGSFFDFILKRGNVVDDKLVRTYFRQLVDGLEYLHTSGVSHMDIKLENLLIGKDFQLKIADFDLSHVIGDAEVISKGTKFYRAPEVMQGRCGNTSAADIYSAGILLFTFLTRGILPHAEEKIVTNVNFAELVHNSDPKFWAEYSDVLHMDGSIFEEEFKELFMSMTRLNPEERATIADIKDSRWYRGPVYSEKELKSIMGRVFCN